MSNNKPAIPTAPRPLPGYGRWLVAVTAGLFVVSTLFPIAASLMAAERMPSWIGGLDVGLAFGVALLAFAISAVAQGHIDAQAQLASYRSYRLLANLILLLLIVFFLLGNQIRWNVLLPGLAWRAWLLVYTLPAALTLRNSRAPHHPNLPIP